jgi:hypothetical protein
MNTPPNEGRPSAGLAEREVRPPGSEGTERDIFAECRAEVASWPKALRDAAALTSELRPNAPERPRTCDDGCNGCDECTDYIEDDAESCRRCHGDGRDPWNDYLLPCPLCQGEQYPL